MRASTTGEWQLRQCPSPACSTTTLRVRRDQRTRDLWWVGRLDYDGTWLIAGTEPCCPQCGSDIEAGLEARENVG
ncbi:MAG TPA: hypothetical protein VFP28_01540 [Gemmatimonadales bacterium]|nr:hypothetical protein [Gemmatimonadales bacterium]